MFVDGMIGGGFLGSNFDLIEGSEGNERRDYFKRPKDEGRFWGKENFSEDYAVDVDSKEMRLLRKAWMSFDLKGVEILKSVKISQTSIALIGVDDDFVGLLEGLGFGSCISDSNICLSVNEQEERFVDVVVNYDLSNYKRYVNSIIKAMNKYS